jgi:hypothetical protein
MINATRYTHTVRRNPDPESEGQWDAWEVLDPDGDVVTCAPTRRGAEIEGEDYSRLLREDLEYDLRQELIARIQVDFDDVSLEKLVAIVKIVEG